MSDQHHMELDERPIVQPEETYHGVPANDNNPDVAAEGEAVPFDPFAALEATGFKAPEPVEVKFPDEEEEPVTEERGPIDMSAFMTADHAEEVLELPPESMIVEATVAPSGNPKDAIGATKPDLSLVPQAGLLYTSQAMMDGAAKYGPYNWRENPVLMRVYIAAAMRHLGQLLDGEDFDPVSGVHHIGHAAACMAIIADARETGNLIDDRPVPGPAGEMIRRFGETGSYRK